MGQHTSTVAKMTIGASQRPDLLSTIYHNQFFRIDERALLHQVEDAFRPELERLKKAPPSDSGSPTFRTKGLVDTGLDPSKELFGQNYDEVNRTLVGVLALRWIINDDYRQFVRGQPRGVQLTSASFQWLRRYFKKNIKTHEDLLALIIAMVINDVGKDENLAEDYLRKTDKKLPSQNHDSILYEAAKEGMIPCLNFLSEEQRQNLLLGLELGSELNAGQLAQAESVPISLEFLQQMKGREHAFELKFMEQLLDVAGALGHKYPYGAKNLIQPVFEGFQTVHEVSHQIISGKLTLRQGYDEVLKKRAALLVSMDFRQLDHHNDEDRALLRLLTMGRTDNKPQAELIDNAFQHLDEKSKHNLIVCLNIDGDVNEKAVLPYYMPSVIAECLEVTKDCSDEIQRRALTALLKYLSRVLTSSSVSQTKKLKTGLHQVPEERQVSREGQMSKDRQMSPEDQVPEEEVIVLEPGIVIESNMLVARTAMNEENFKVNPEKLLEELSLPAPQQLIRRRTSQSVDSMPQR